MDEKKRIYLFQGKRVWITNKERLLLYLIWKHKVVSVAQIQFYLRNLYNDKEFTVYKKLQKWHNLNIITSESYCDGKNPYKCVRIARNGIEILKNEGFTQKNAESYKHVKIPKHATADHFFGTREVIIRFIIEAEQKGIQSFDSFPPYELPYHDVMDVKALEQHVTSGAKITPMVIPDWILISESAILNIESDTGSEYSEAIIEKVKKYVQYVEQGQESKEHHVLIVPPDSRDDDILCYVKNPPKDRSKRLGTLKDNIMKVSAHIVPKLHFHVVSSSRSGKVAYNILSGSYRKHEALAAEVVEAFKRNKNLSMGLEEIRVSEIYNSALEEALYADRHLLLRGQDGKSKLVLVKIMDEGSVKSLDELTYLNYLVENDRLERKVDEVLAIYKTEEERQNDVLGERWDLKYVLFSSIQQLNKNGKSGPTFYRSTSPLKKSRCSLYEG